MTSIRTRAITIVATGACLLTLAAPGTAPARAFSTISPTPPAGFTLTTDDTGTISLLVPNSWIDVDTAPWVDEGGIEHPRIVAAPDIDTFNETFDVPGVVYLTYPYVADPEAVLRTDGLANGCETFVVDPFDGELFDGFAQTGDRCGSGTATWHLSVGSPADRSFTALVASQTATPADQPTIDTVTGSLAFTATPVLLALSQADASDRLRPMCDPGDNDDLCDLEVER